MAAILIVDDEPVVREPIAHALQLHGHEVLTASDGREALGVLNGRAINLVVLDVQMPNMDGLDLLRQMRDRQRLAALPVILLTESSDRQIVMRARALGVAHYLLKASFAIDELIARVSDAIDPKGDRREDGLTSGAVGDRDEAAPGRDLTSLKPIITRSELLERLDEWSELKALSPTVSEVIRLSRRANGSIEDVANAIKRDPAIAVKVLRLANSAAYSGDHPVESVDRAAVRMGMTAICQAVVNIGVIDQLSEGEYATGIDLRLFWEHSIGCALIASRIAAQSGAMAPDAAFTAGLIHDVGRIVFAGTLADDYARVLRVAEELMHPLERVEARMLLMNHAEGMHRVLQAWQLPREMIEPVVLHHHELLELKRAAPRRVPEVATVSLANALSHALLIGSSSNDTIYQTAQLCDALGVDASMIAAIGDTIRNETDELKLAMMTTSSADEWPDARAIAIERLGVPLRPIVVSARPGVDAVRLFFEQIADCSVDTPNVSVLHVEDRREFDSLSGSLADAEREAGVDALPLLVLSPDARVSAGSALKSERPCASVAVPFTHKGLGSALDRLLGSRNARSAA